MWSTFARDATDCHDRRRVKRFPAQIDIYYSAWCTNAIWKARRCHNMRATHNRGIKRKEIRILRKILRNKRWRQQRVGISLFGHLRLYCLFIYVCLFFTRFAFGRCPLSISRLRYNRDANRSSEIDERWEFPTARTAMSVSRRIRHDFIISRRGTRTRR